jgi:hypothetical protein
LEDEIHYPHYKFFEPAMKLPLLWKEAQPVVGKKILTMSIQPESEDVVSLVWSGQTYNLRDALDVAGIKGAYQEETSGDQQVGRKYYRVLQSFDVTASENKGKIQRLLSETFKNLATRVLVSPAEEDSSVAAFIEELREIPSLHFEDA